MISQEEETMATKKAASKTKKPVSGAKKTSAAKTVKKRAAVKAVKKGAKYVCEVCGLAVTVDNVCGCVESCDIICCGQQMKTKK